MKDIVIKKGQIKREIIILAGFLVFSVLLNIYSIIIYEGEWRELYTQLHIVLILTVVLYLLTGFTRGIICLIIKLIKRKY